MKINGKINYHKALFLEESALKSFDNILRCYSNDIRYSATTMSKTRIDFDNFEELVNYENYGNTKIKFLEVIAYARFERILSVYFEYYDSNARLLGYYSTFRCDYGFNSFEEEQKFKNEIQKFLKKNTPNYWLLGKIRIYGLVVIPSLFITYYRFLNGSFNDSKGLSFMNSILVLVIAIAIMLGLSFIDRKLLDPIFPAIVFNIGDEIKKQDKYSEIRKNILWCIIIALILGVISEAINRAIFS